VPIAVGMNMVDVAQQEGLQVEPRVLEAALGVPVIPLTATRAAGVSDLLAEIEHTLTQGRSTAPKTPAIRPDHRAALAEVISQIQGHVPEPYPSDDPKIAAWDT